MNRLQVKLTEIGLHLIDGNQVSLTDDQLALLQAWGGAQDLGPEWLTVLADAELANQTDLTTDSSPSDDVLLDPRIQATVNALVTASRPLPLTESEIAAAQPVRYAPGVGTLPRATPSATSAPSAPILPVPAAAPLPTRRGGPAPVPAPVVYGPPIAPPAFASNPMARRAVEQATENAVRPLGTHRTDVDAISVSSSQDSFETTLEARVLGVEAQKQIVRTLRVGELVRLKLLISRTNETRLYEAAVVAIQRDPVYAVVECRPRGQAPIQVGLPIEHHERSALLVVSLERTHDPDEVMAQLFEADLQVQFDHLEPRTWYDQFYGTRLTKGVRDLSFKPPSIDDVAPDQLITSFLHALRAQERPAPHVISGVNALLVKLWLQRLRDRKEEAVTAIAHEFIRQSPHGTMRWLWTSVEHVIQKHRMEQTVAK